MSAKPPPRPLSEAEQVIVKYLTAHPDFFNRHPGLVERLRIPHPCRPAASLLERQIQLLRERNTQLRHKLEELVEVARENGLLIARLQRLTLTLLDARTLTELLHGVETVLREEFKAEFIALRLTPPAWPVVWDERLALSRPTQALLEPLLQVQQPLCGRLTRGQLQALFGPAATQVASVALAPLQGDDWRGLLAIGSRDEARFHPGMGTLILRCMSRLISHALQIYIRHASGASPYRSTGEGGD